MEWLSMTSGTGYIISLAYLVPEIKEAVKKSVGHVKRTLKPRRGEGTPIALI